MAFHKTEKHGEVIVHFPSKNSEGFSISYIHGGWMPGIYDSVESAIRGAECCFKDESLFVKTIKDPINHYDKGNRLITLSDMFEF